MLNLKISMNKFDVSIKNYIKEEFKFPIVLSYFNKNDSFKILAGFIITDFSNNSVTYLESFNKENINIVQKYKDNWGKIDLMEDIHSFIKVNDNVLLAFTQETNFFYYIDLNNLFINLYFWAEDFTNLWIWEILKFSPTNFKDPDDESSFIFSATSLQDWKIYYNFLKSTLDLSEIKLLYRYERHIDNKFVCHTTRKYDKSIYVSNFDDVNLYCEEINKTFTESEYRQLALTFLKNFNLYEKIIDTYTDLDKAQMPLLRNLLDKILWILKSARFDYSDNFIRKFFKKLDRYNFLDFLEITKYKAKALAWNFNSYDINSFTETIYNTSFSRPAHFEFYENEIYVSSHNFIYLDRRYYLGQAALDKFIIENWILQKIWTFYYEKWYRYTSHRVFEYNWKKYICTIWQPNRLLLIDAETMELYSYYDIWENILDNQNNLKTFLNSFRWDSYVSLEVSASWKYIIITSNWEFLVFSIDEMKVLDTVCFLERKLIDFDNIEKKIITHIQYLK